jgi:hypothetical protein
MDMATANFYILAKPPQSDQVAKEEHRVATAHPSFSRSKAKREPETRLWKVCFEAASPRLSGLEWVAFLLFGSLVLGALVYCFSEFCRLLSNDTLEQTVGLLLGAYHAQG